MAGDETEVVSPVAVFIRKNTWAFPAAIALVIALVAGGIYMSSRPAHGSWRYGVCRALVEFEFAFPPTFDVMSVAEERAGVRFFMAEKNPFGNERIIQVDCEYQINGQQVALSRMLLDRKAIPANRVAKYSQMMPVLMSMKNLDTALPPPMAKSLDQLKR